MILQPTLKVDTTAIEQEHITVILTDDMCLSAFPGEPQRYLRNIVLRNRACKCFVVVVTKDSAIEDMCKRFAEGIKPIKTVIGYSQDGVFFQE